MILEDDGNVRKFITGVSCAHTQLVLKDVMNFLDCNDYFMIPR